MNTIKSIKYCFSILATVLAVCLPSCCDFLPNESAKPSPQTRKTDSDGHSKDSTRAGKTDVGGGGDKGRLKTDPPSKQENPAIAVRYRPTGSLPDIEPPPYPNLRIFASTFDPLKKTLTIKAFNDTSYSLVQPSSPRYDPNSEKLRFDSKVTFTVLFENGAMKPGTVSGSCKFWLLKKENDFIRVNSWARGGRPPQPPADGKSVELMFENFLFPKKWEDRSKDRQSLWLHFFADHPQRITFLVIPERNPNVGKQ